MYQKQAAFLRIIADNPGINANAAGKMYLIKHKDVSKYTAKCIPAMLEPVTPSGKNPGRAPYVRRTADPEKPHLAFALFITDEGLAALIKHEQREGKHSFHEPKTFTIEMAPAAARAASNPLPSSTVASYTDPNGGLKRGVYAEPPPAMAAQKRQGQTDMQLYNIRIALKEARDVHDQIKDKRGGPAVLVDARFEALMRAMDLLVNKLYG